MLSPFVSTTAAFGNNRSRNDRWCPFIPSVLENGSGKHHEPIIHTDLAVAAPSSLPRRPHRSLLSHYRSARLLEPWHSPFSTTTFHDPRGPGSSPSVGRVPSGIPPSGTGTQAVGDAAHGEEAAPALP